MFFLITGLLICLGLMGFLLYEVLTPGTRWRYFLCRTGSNSGQTKMTCGYTSAYEVRYLLHIKLYCTASVSAVFHLAYSISPVCHDRGLTVLYRATNKSLFNNKDKNTHRSKVVYKGDCSCGIDCIGETEKLSRTNCGAFKSCSHEPAKHVRESPSHSFTWRVLSSAQTFHIRGANDPTITPQFEQTSYFLYLQTFPIRNYIRYICMCGRSPFYL